MSVTPTHVGECPVMTFTSQLGGLPIANQPWERFVVMDDDFLQHLPLRDMEQRRDGMAVEVTLRCANGSATYRRVGRDAQQKRLIWELIEGTNERDLSRPDLSVP